MALGTLHSREQRGKEQERRLAQTHTQIQTLLPGDLRALRMKTSHVLSQQLMGLWSGPHQETGLLCVQLGRPQAVPTTGHPIST